MSKRSNRTSIQNLINANSDDDSVPCALTSTGGTSFSFSHTTQQGRDSFDKAQTFQGHYPAFSGGYPAGNHPSRNLRGTPVDTLPGGRLPPVQQVLVGGNSAGSSFPPTPITPDGGGSSQDAAASSSRVKKPGYPCERCGRMFGRKPDALKHIRVVHDRIKSFQCSVCGKKFGRKDYCMKHEKSIHNIQPPPNAYQRRKPASQSKK